MFAVIHKPPDRETLVRQTDLITKIIDVLARIFGAEKTKEKNFVRRYVEDNDGMVKSIPRLSEQLMNLQEQELRENDFDDIRLPGETSEHSETQ